MSVFVPGFGAMPNSHLNLVNVDDNWTRYGLMEGMHRSKDVGVGAFTGYHGRSFAATRDLSEGSEIFVSYGEVRCLNLFHVL